MVELEVADFQVGYGRMTPDTRIMMFVLAGTTSIHMV